MNNAPLGLEIYLEPTYFVDSTQPDIVRFVKNTIGNEIDKTKNAIKLYNAVRDGWRYNPYNIDLKHTALKHVCWWLVCAQPIFQRVFVFLM